jgi:deoxyuridine 5'-triphosphate nucleotidohydrolase
MVWLKKKILAWLFTYQYDIHIGPFGKIPVRAYQNDAGYDLFISKSIVVPAGKGIEIPTEIYCRSKIPAWIMLTSRSSTMDRWGVLVKDAVIDSEYTGELYIYVHNLTKKDVHLPIGIRIGQIIVIPHTTIKFNVVDKDRLINSTRGSRGFGSSGQ